MIAVEIACERDVMTTRLNFIVGTVAALAMAGTADAAVMRATLTGTAFIKDCGRYFGAASGAKAACSSGELGSFYSDAPFTLTFDYQTALGQPIPGYPASVWGGADLGTQSPIFAATFTAAGSQVDIAPISYAMINQVGDTILFEAVGNENGANDPLSTGDVVWVWNANFARDGVPAPSFRDPISADGMSGGLITFRERLNHPTGYADVEASLNVTHLTITAIPEPATWALLIFGFGMVGSSARRKRNSPARLSSRSK